MIGADDDLMRCIDGSLARCKADGKLRRCGVPAPCRCYGVPPYAAQYLVTGGPMVSVYLGGDDCSAVDVSSVSPWDGVLDTYFPVPGCRWKKTNTGGSWQGRSLDTAQLDLIITPPCRWVLALRVTINGTSGFGADFWKTTGKSPKGVYTRIYDPQCSPRTLTVS